MNKWDARFLEMAALVASWSKDPSTKCGCVIVRPDNTICSLGFNGFPRGMSDQTDLYEDRATKYARIIHAEMNAILNTRENIQGFTAFVHPFSPCERCAVHLIQAGIKRIVCLATTEDKVRWQESFNKAKMFFKEAGVELVVYE